MPLIPALVLGLAHAHGPAPAALGVLAWEDAGCEAVPAGRTPALVRSNIGLLAHAGDGTYTYGCPSRWGDTEQALAVADPRGQQVLLAGSVGAWWSPDAGCTAVALDLPREDVPLDLAWAGDRALLLTRRFDDGSTALWGARDGGLELLLRTDALAADGLAVGPDGRVWLAGEAEGPVLAIWEGGALGSLRPLLLDPVPERLRPRLADADGLWLVAGVGTRQELVRVEEDAVLPTGLGGTVLLGPARLGGEAAVAIDGRLWGEGAEGWTERGSAEGWTCLGTGPAGAYACALDRVFALEPTGGQPRVTTVFSLVQLGGPDPSCPDPQGSCALEWAHFGGESGLVDTSPATCPDGRRGTPDTGDTGAPGPGESCGCASSGGGALALLPLAGLLRRRRRAC
ncbi:MAG: hypothetical protein H6732_07490 [Alphaproteobacteria bacterium]|nr:hypothetical protein [Alphaproteobacteria bacterium]